MNYKIENNILEVKFRLATMGSNIESALLSTSTGGLGIPPARSPRDPQSQAYRPCYYSRIWRNEQLRGPMSAIAALPRRESPGLSLRRAGTD